MKMLKERNDRELSIPQKSVGIPMKKHRGGIYENAKENPDGIWRSPALSSGQIVSSNRAVGRNHYRDKYDPLLSRSKAIIQETQDIETIIREQFSMI